MSSLIYNLYFQQRCEPKLVLGKFLVNSPFRSIGRTEHSPLRSLQRSGSRDFHRLFEMSLDSGHCANWKVGWKKWNEYQIKEKHVSVAHNGFKRATTMCIFDNPNTIEIKLIRFSISVMPLRSILKRFRFQLPVWIAASIARVILFCSDFIDDITSTTCQKGVLI